LLPGTGSAGIISLAACRCGTGARPGRRHSTLSKLWQWGQSAVQAATSPPQAAQT
jgi:hypothetical protein